MTQKELVYLQNSKDYENNDLINSFDQYNLYAKNLEKLEHCTNKIDLRNVFDNELKSIYIDEESHISDNGNSIVANSIFDIILPNISKENILNHPINNEAESINSNISIELEYFFNNVFSNFVKKLELNIFSLSQTNDSLPNILKSEEIIIETQSLFFENNEIKIIIELAPSFNQSSNDKIIKIKTMDETNNSIIHNVTYLITITKNMNELFTNYFFAEDELIIQTTHNDENVKISGERRYELNALVVNSDMPIIISGDFFDSNSTYEFDISLRTIHDPENYIFLNGFHAEIIP
jgi:hypothetical protein